MLEKPAVLFCAAVLLTFFSCGPSNEETQMQCGGSGSACVKLDDDPAPLTTGCAKPTSQWGYLDPSIPACEPIPQTTYCTPQIGPDGKPVHAADGTVVYVGGSQFSKQGDEGDDISAKGGGCVFRSMREVWGVQITAPAMTLLGPDHGDSEVTGIDLDPNDPSEIFRFNLHCHLYHFPVGDLNWDIMWKHALLAGTRTHPKIIRVDWSKVDGMDYIQYQRGSIRLTELGPNVVGVTEATEIHARQTSAQDAQDGLAQAFDLLRNAQPNLDSLPKHD